MYFLVMLHVNRTASFHKEKQKKKKKNEAKSEPLKCFCIHKMYSFLISFVEKMQVKIQ